MVMILCRVLVSLNVLSFLWSVIGIFKSNKEKVSMKYRGLQISSLLTWGSCLYSVFSAELNLQQASALFFFQIICFVTFWSHAQLVRRHQFTIVYSLDQPKKLIKSGLYGYVRNPFYLTYLICYFSVGLMTLNGLVIICSFIMLWFYIDAARLEEQKFMTSSLAQEYSDYFHSTGRFLPRFAHHKKQKL